VAAADSVAVGDPDGVSDGELSTGLGEKLSVGLGSVVGASVVSISLGDCSGLSVGPELSLGIGAAVSVGDSLGRPLAVGRWLGVTPPAIEGSRHTILPMQGPRVGRVARRRSVTLASARPLFGGRARTRARPR